MSNNIYYQDLDEDFELKFEESIKFLCSFKNPVDILESQKAYEKLNFVYSLASAKIFSEITNKLEIISKNNFLQVIADLFCYITDNLNLIDFNNCKQNVSIFYYYEETTLYDRYLFNMTHAIIFMNFIFPLSTEACFFMTTDKKRLNAFFKIISQHEFHQNLLKFLPGALASVIFDLNWISKVSDSYKSIWHEINAIPILINFSKEIDEWNLYVHMIMANIAYDNEIENIPEINESIDKFVDLACTCINNESPDKREYQFFDDEYKTQHKFEVREIKEKQIYLTLNGLLLSLFRLAINDKIKWNLYTKPNLKDSLIKIIYKGVDVEIQYAMQLLVQLCFDDKVRDDLAQNQKFFEYVKDLLVIKRKNTDYKKLIKTCEQLVWQLENSNKIQTGDSISTGKHIMISYNTESRPLCLRIKEDLEKHNFKVWIDVNEIHGSSLDSMAKAVENAICVLMCVTEKYRQSNNCQTEAQYAHRLNKKIIPVIMQKDYHKINGWLGIIIGDKIFIDFTNQKYSVDECLKKLRNQLELNIKSDSNEDDKSEVPNALSSYHVESIKESQQVQSKKSASNWENKQVENWFNEKTLMDIYNDLKPVDGKLLYQLYQLQLYTPEFFYKSISKNQDLNLKSVALFSLCLKELFEN